MGGGKSGRSERLSSRSLSSVSSSAGAAPCVGRRTVGKYTNTTEVPAQHGQDPQSRPGGAVPSAGVASCLQQQSGVASVFRQQRSLCGPSIEAFGRQKAPDWRSTLCAGAAGTAAATRSPARNSRNSVFISVESYGGCGRRVNRYSFENSMGGVQRPPGGCRTFSGRYSARFGT